MGATDQAGAGEGLQFLCAVGFGDFRVEESVKAEDFVARILQVRA